MVTDANPILLISIGLLAAFAAVLLLGMVVTTAVTQRRSVYRSLRSMGSAELPADAVRERQLALPAMRRLVLPGLNRVSGRILRFTPPAIVDRLDQELVYAGSPLGWTGTRLLALKWLVGGLLAVAGVVLLPLSGVGVVSTIFILPVLVLIGYYIPEWVVRSRGNERQKQIQLALPDALDLLAITVEAGLGFDAAMERVSREMGGPLGEELYRVVQEMRLGKGRGEALRDLADRTSVDELKGFVMAMVQAEIFGISVANVLNVQANELRIKRRQRAQEAAHKLPVKIIFPMLIFIFPSLFLVILGPAAISIYENLVMN